MRPSSALLLILVIVVAFDCLLFFSITEQRQRWQRQLPQVKNSFQVLGLSDLAVSTEARYTRHPAVTDGVVPFMDHPGALEHFPSGSFFTPVQ